MDNSTLQSYETQDLIDSLVAFSRESMAWCAKESENSSRQVSQILQILMADADRISRMSAETMRAVSELRTQLNRLINAGRTSELVASLKRLCEQHVEVGEFVYPIIEALQFQDRITQNMENLVRMLITWSIDRETLKTQKSVLTAEQKKSFGERLLECTTMCDERDTIRRVITELPPEDDRAEGVMLF